MTTRLHRLLAGPWPQVALSPPPDIPALVAAATLRHAQRMGRAS